ncbi:MAG: restriction endonuclease [Alcanivorax sp.]
MNFSDRDVAQRIRDFERALEKWAVANDLWFDCGFQSYAHRVDGEPSDPPVATIVHFGSEFARVLDEDDPELHQELEAIEKQHGFWHERWDGVSAYFYVEEDNPLAAPIAEYMRWQWICSLVKPDFDDVYEEMYCHFTKRPNDIHKLHWRQFEILVTGALRNQGFDAQIGPGRSDGGIDIRLVQRNPLGDILTMVQVKRYAPHRKIDLQAVQALYGAAHVEGAQKSLFVTSSSYLPGAEEWAGRTSGHMTLAASDDVLRWCQDASHGVIKDKSRLVDPANVTKLIANLRGKTDPRIVHASIGVTMIMNSFALVLKETHHAALLVALPEMKVSSDGYGQTGTEAPLLDPINPPRLTGETVWRAKRRLDEGRVSYWDGNYLYTPWDGQPKHFNYMD